MKLRRSYIVTFASCVLALLSSYRQVSADSALKDRFLEEAPRKWREYSSLLRGFEVSSEHIIEANSIGATGDGEKQTQRESDHIILADSGVSALKKQGLYTYVSNQEYSFTLGQSVDTLGQSVESNSQSLSILDLYPQHPLSSQHAKPASEAIKAAARRVGTIWHLYPLDFLELVTSTSFKVVNAKEIVENGENVVRIDFEYSPQADSNSYPFSIYQGHALFSPAKYWAVVGGNVTVKDPQKQVGGYELHNRFGQVLGQIPVVTNSDYLIFNVGHALLESMVSTYAWSKFEGDEDQFTLSRYGFSEPSFQTALDAKRWFFYLNIVVVLACLLLLVYRSWRKQQGSG